MPRWQRPASTRPARSRSTNALPKSRALFRAKAPCLWRFTSGLKPRPLKNGFMRWLLVQLPGNRSKSAASSDYGVTRHSVASGK